MHQPDPLCCFLQLYACPFFAVASKRSIHVSVLGGSALFSSAFSYLSIQIVTFGRDLVASLWKKVVLISYTGVFSPLSTDNISLFMCVYVDLMNLSTLRGPVSQVPVLVCGSKLLIHDEGGCLLCTGIILLFDYNEIPVTLATSAIEFETDAVT